MNSTQRTLAIVAVFALMAAGFAGVAYAYTTQTDITDNTAPSEYYLISSGEDTPTAKSYINQFKTGVKYDTVTYSPSFTNADATKGDVGDNLYKVEYTLKPDTEAMTGSVYGMKLANLGNVKLNVATQDGAAPDYDATTAGTYDIEVLIPYDKADSGLYYFAKAEATGFAADKPFAVTDTGVNKFIKITEGGVEYLAAYITVPDAISLYTVYIGAAAQGDAPNVKYYEALPTESVKVLDDADITFRVNSESLIPTGKSMIIDFSTTSTPAYATDITMVTTAVDDPANSTELTKIFASVLSYGDVAPTAVFSVMKGDSVDAYVTYVDDDNALESGASKTAEVARTLKVSATLTDNQVTWVPGGNNATAQTAEFDFAITYTLPSITIATAATDGIEFDQLVMPTTGTRYVLADGYTSIEVTLPDGITGLAVDGTTKNMVTSTSYTGGTVKFTVLAVKEGATYTGVFDVDVRSATVTTSSTLYIADDYKDSRAVIFLTEGVKALAVKYDTANTYVGAHKAAKWYLDAKAVTTSAQPMYVISSKTVEDEDTGVITTTYYADDLQIFVAELTVAITGLTVGQADVAPAISDDDATLVSMESANTNIISITGTGADSKAHAVAAGATNVTVVFTVAGVNYTIVVSATVAGA